MYEYKFLPAPPQVQRGTSMLNGPDALTRTLDSEINLVAGGGWEFLRTERIPVKGRWLFLSVTRQRDYLIFRRPQIPDPAVPAVRPRRVRAQGRAVRARPEDGALA